MRNHSSRALSASLILGTAVLLSVSVQQANAGTVGESGVWRFGAFGEGTFSRFNVTSTPSGGVASSSTLDVNGAGGGLAIGYDRRFGALTFGLEGDTSVGDNSHALNGVSYGMDYLATVRARVGMNVRPDVLLYATGGVALEGTRAQRSYGSGTFSNFQTKFGGVAGVGGEVELQYVTLFAEYLYAGFAGSSTGASNGDQYSLDNSANLFRLGVKFRLDNGYNDDVRSRR